jgi:hypothetical protein
MLKLREENNLKLEQQKLKRLEKLAKGKGKGNLEGKGEK